jgi:hypothetical protein
VLLLMVTMATACAGAPEPVAPRSAAPPAAKLDVRAAEIERLLNAGRAAARQQRWPEAEAALRQAAKAAYGFSAPWSSYRSEALSELARCLLAQGRPAEARATVAQGLAPLRAGGLDADQRIVELQTIQAEAFLLEEQPASAVAAFETAALAAARHLELAPAQLAVSLRWAETLGALGRRQHATNALERALPVARRPEVGVDLARRLARALAALYDASGEHEKSRTLLAELAPDEAPAATTETAAAPTTAEAAEAGNNAAEVVAMQADFRACYRKAVQNHADVAGRVALVLSIAADGRVSDVKANTTNLPRSAVECLKRRAALAHFEPPKGGGAVITVPVTFVKQEND